MNRFFGCFILLVLVISIAVFGPVPCWADTLTLDDGQVLKGSFKGIAGGKVQFEAFGNTMVFPAGKIKSLTLEGQQAAPAPTAKPAPSVAPAKAPGTGPVTVPPGTDLVVKLQTNLVTGRSHKGDPFICSLEKPVVVNGQTVFAKGSKVYGRVVESIAARRLAGRAKLIIQVTEVEIAGNPVVVGTEAHSYEGASSGTLRKVAVGAALGSVDDNKEGAQRGAAYGGAVAAMTPGNQIQIKAGTLMTFRLSAPVTVGR